MFTLNFSLPTFEAVQFLTICGLRNLTLTLVNLMCHRKCMEVLKIYFVCWRDFFLVNFSNNWNPFETSREIYLVYFLVILSHCWRTGDGVNYKCNVSYIRDWHMMRPWDHDDSLCLKKCFHFIILSILRTPSASNINILVFSSIWIFFDTNFDSNWLQCKFLMLIMKYNKCKTQNHYYRYLRKGYCTKHVHG